MNTNNPAHLPPAHGSVRAKGERILAGLRRLQSTQQPNQAFTPTQIAQECGCSERAITFIERKALYRLAQRLRKAAPGLFEELSPDSNVLELFTRLAVNPMKSGRPSHIRLTRAELKIREIRPNLKELKETFASPAGTSRGFGVPVAV